MTGQLSCPDSASSLRRTSTPRSLLSDPALRAGAARPGLIRDKAVPVRAAILLPSSFGSRPDASPDLCHDPDRRQRAGTGQRPLHNRPVARVDTPDRATGDHACALGRIPQRPEFHASPYRHALNSIQIGGPHAHTSGLNQVLLMRQQDMAPGSPAFLSQTSGVLGHDAQAVNVCGHAQELANGNDTRTADAGHHNAIGLI